MNQCVCGRVCAFVNYWVKGGEKCAYREKKGKKEATNCGRVLGYAQGRVCVPASGERSVCDEQRNLAGKHPRPVSRPLPRMAMPYSSPLLPSFADASPTASPFINIIHSSLIEKVFLLRPGLIVNTHTNIFDSFLLPVSFPRDPGIEFCYINSFISYISLLSSIHEPINVTV